MFTSKNLIRSFVLGLMLLIAVDSWPPHTSIVPVKAVAALIADGMGVRQGSWAMFTPNPVINNRWISAELKTKDGRIIHWDSPLWVSSNTWDKFIRFRHINFYNRVYQNWCMAGRTDFLRYVARQSGEELESIQLHLNRLELIMPEDGSFPVRDEAEWRLISEPWIGETYEP